MGSSISTYLLIYGLLALEGTIVLGVFFPGVTVLVAAGFLAGSGTISPFLAFTLAWLGLISGDSLTYAFGRFGISRFDRIFTYVETRRESVTRSLSGRQPTIFFFQFPLPTRVLVPAVAGLIKFPVWQWLLIDTPASALFVGVVGGAGFIIGRVAGSLGLAQSVGKYIQLVFLGLFLFYVLFQVARSIRSRKRG